MNKNFYIVNNINNGEMLIEEFDAELIEWFNARQKNGIVETRLWITVGPFTEQEAQVKLQEIEEITKA